MTARTAAIAAVLLALPAGLALSQPKITVTAADRPAVTQVTLPAGTTPLGTLMTQLARPLGFERVELGDAKLAATPTVHDFVRKPAWGCLVGLARKHGRILVPSGKVLHVRSDLPGGASAPGRPVHQAAAGPLLVSFRQDPIGKTRPAGAPVYLPYDMRLDAEPGASWQCRKWAITAQTDGAGKPVPVLVARHFDGLRPQLDPAGALYPWRGVRQMKLALTVSVVTRWTTAKIRGLAQGQKACDVTHEGKALFTLAKIHRVGDLVCVDFSLPHPEQHEFAGLGSVVDLAKTADLRVVVRDAKGTPFDPDIISGDGGDESPLLISLRFRTGTLTQRGGLAKLSLSIGLAGKRETLDLTATLDKLLD